MDRIPFLSASPVCSPEESLRLPTTDPSRHPPSRVNLRHELFRLFFGLARLWPEHRPEHQLDHQLTFVDPVWTMIRLAAP